MGSFESDFATIKWLRHTRGRPKPVVLGTNNDSRVKKFQEKIRFQVGW